MKILVCPDVHGTHSWEKAANRLNEVDKIVFLGDY
jgi:predicted phosphodiesterase